MNPEPLTPSGLWPVMLTAFHHDKSIDWDGIDRLTDRYLDSGAAGLFAVCGSSEMYELTEEERLALAARVVKRAGSTPVIASGTFGGEIAHQAEFVKRMYGTGVRAVVCLVSQLATEDQPDRVWQDRMAELLEMTRDIPFGFYECPAPYHRLLSPALLAWAVSTGRIFWLKETSEQIDLIRQKIDVVRGSHLHFYNAHTATLLPSLRAGGNGFSGIAANFYPALFSWLCRNFTKEPEIAEELQQFLTVSQDIVTCKYFSAAKQFVVMNGLKITTTCRVEEHSFNQIETENLHRLRKESNMWHEKLRITT